MSAEEYRRLDELEKRIEKLEKHMFEDTLTLLEMLSSTAFFGSLKMEKCEYATNGQCALFILQTSAKRKIPVASACRISDCECETSHCHLELSNVTCAFCPTRIWGRNPTQSVKRLE